MRRGRIILFAGFALAGFALGAARTSEAFRIVVLVAAVVAATWIIRDVIDRSRTRPADVVMRPRRGETYWPARCSHCGTRGSQSLRMVAGRDAYICELCLRRGIELLDAPDDITRFV